MSTGSTPHPDAEPGQPDPPSPGEPSTGTQATGAGSPQPGQYPQPNHGAAQPGPFPPGTPPQGQSGPVPPQGQYPHPQQHRYPQQQQQRPRAPRVPMRVTALVGAGLAVVSAALLVVGSFLDLTAYKQFEDNAASHEVHITAWGRTITPPPSGRIADFYNNSHPAYYGIPLVVIAIALIAGAVLAFLTARTDVPARRLTVARAVAVSACAAAVASVLTLSMDVQATTSLEGADPEDHVTYDAGIGYWLLVGAAVVAIAAAVLVLLRQRDAGSDKTPPQGFRAPMAYARPQAPQQQRPGPQQWRPMQQPGGQVRPGAPTGPAPSPVAPPSAGPAREHPLEADAPTQWRPTPPPEQPNPTEQPAGQEQPPGQEQPWEPPSSEEFTSRLEPGKPESGNRD